MVFVNIFYLYLSLYLYMFVIKLEFIFLCLIPKRSPKMFYFISGRKIHKSNFSKRRRKRSVSCIKPNEMMKKQRNGLTLAQDSF